MRAALEQARHGVRAFRTAPLDLPHDSRSARVGWGAGLPFAIMRRVLADPVARAAYLPVKLTQLSIVIGVTALVLLVSGVEGAPPRRDDVHGTRVHIGPTSVHVDDAPAPKRGPSRAVAVLSSIYATLLVVEWIVIALSRQYDDQISGQASHLVGVVRDDPPARARVRLDLAWLWRKTKRRLRALRMLLAGLPLFALVLAVPFVGSVLYGGLATAWGFYWLMVLLAATTSTAWAEEATAGDPFFLRALERVAAVSPAVLAWMPRLYARFARKMTRALASPCAAVERAPLPLLGLAACRSLLGVPGAYLFLRPFFPVAAARIHADAAARLAPPATPAEAVSPAP